MDVSKLCHLCRAGIPNERVLHATLEGPLEGDMAPAGWTSIVFALVLLLSSAIAGIALRRRFPSAKVGGINSVCGGMFLGMALFHVLPEASEGSPHWPFFTAGGYLLGLFVDRVVAPHDHGGDYASLQRTIALPSNSMELGEPRRAELGDLSPGAVQRNSIASGDGQLSLAGDRREVTQNASVALVFTLSLHSIFEGLAVGSSSSASMLLLAGVISAHKWAAAFALTSFVTVDGVPLDTRRIIVLAVFVIASPIGALLGLLARASENVAAPVTAAAGGTLLFVAMTEVIPSEFSKSSSSARNKFALILLGMGVILLLLTVFSEERATGSDPDQDKLAAALSTLKIACAEKCS